MVIEHIIEPLKAEIQGLEKLRRLPLLLVVMMLAFMPNLTVSLLVCGVSVVHHPMMSPDGVAAATVASFSFSSSSYVAGSSAAGFVRHLPRQT
jgi:hypothetical protein